MNEIILEIRSIASCYTHIRKSSATLEGVSAWFYSEVEEPHEDSISLSSSDEEILNWLFA